MSSDGKSSHCLWQGEIKMVPVMIKNLKILRNSLQQLFLIFSSELLGQMNRNLVGSIIGRSSI
jgi:hypothetical protein